MNCIKCSFENDDNARYCENCGSPLTLVCAQCGSPLNRVSKFCKECGTPVPFPPPTIKQSERLAELQQSTPTELQEKMRVASVNLEGERKPVTILFTDIVGSTSLAEKLDPEEWKEIVNEAHRRVCQAVYRYEGTVAQLLGDGVLAFFGAPITHEDDPIRAVRAALDIQEAIAEYAHKLRGYIDNFEMRVGLNTGTVVVGNVGSDLHLEYLAVGDAVNLAARMQSAAQPGRVLVSESTARLVKAAFELHCLGEISVKGKAEPVIVFQVEERKAIPESGRGFEELHSPLVGREVELGALHSALDALLAGHGQIVSVIGEAGIGKSRLVEEARCKTSGLGLHWIEGRALSYGGSLSFWCITQLIKSDLGLSDGDPEARIHLALRRRVNGLFGEKAAEVLPYLAHLLGVKLDDQLNERVQALAAETLKRQSLLSIAQYFTRLAQQQPLVLVFEDLQWADPSSLEALEQLLSATDRVPIMLLLLSRLEREHGSWRIKLKAETDFTHRYTEINLKPLSANEQNRLVDNLLAIADLPESVRKLILERAEGNPFYLEEIVRSLIEQGAIVQDGKSWQASGKILNVTIPDTLQGVLLARIDRLQEDVRRTLQLASVIGRSFLYKLLEAIAEAEQQLDAHLAQLQRVDLVREKSRLPELEYMFKHSLTQEAAYNSLLLERRREFHRKVGEALETLFAGRKEDFLGLLAHHFDAAGDREKAVVYLIRAGDKARLTDEHTEAIGFYQRAVELLANVSDVRRLAQVWLKLGLVYHANFQFEEVYKANEMAFALQKRLKSNHLATLDTTSKRLRIQLSGDSHNTLDPGIAISTPDWKALSNLFSGLVRVDEELNVVPDVARSWQVLDGGRRYLFHLREDNQWTDGTPVTARDFEWAWKRNLDPKFNTLAAQFLYDVVGARQFHEGHNLDPDSVEVHALDALTLEICLAEPIAYFLYLSALPVTFPLPQMGIERYKDNWWLPEHIVSNGSFRLLEFNYQRGGLMERSPKHHSKYTGNVREVEWKISGDPKERLTAYQENYADVIWIRGPWIPTSIPSDERYVVFEKSTRFVVFNPSHPPFDDLRVRQAFAFALDRSRLSEMTGMPPINGGAIPPGLPGHSPDIGLPSNLETAHKLLAEAGFPNGSGIPILHGRTPFTETGPTPWGVRIADLWGSDLGVHIELEAANMVSEFGGLIPMNIDRDINMAIWGADYPDPDNFTRNFSATHLLHQLGWRDAEFDRLVETAAKTTNRARRMAMYRQADRILVSEQVLVLPIDYPGEDIFLVKPWVKNFRVTPLGMPLLTDVIVEDH